MGKKIYKKTITLNIEPRNHAQTPFIHTIMVNTAEEQSAEQMQEQPPRGRAAMMAMYKERNPETSDEVDDDTLFDWAGQGYTQHDEMKGKYDGLNSANEKLAAVVAEDPRFAKFMAMVAHGENLMYALGKNFGNLLDELSEGDLEQLRKGQEEFKGQFSKVRDNFNSYQASLKKYGEANGLEQELVDRIDDAINDIADAFADRVIPEELIELVHKGLEADNISIAELEAAKVAGANDAIDAMKGKKAEASPVPDVQGSKQKTDKAAQTAKFNDKKSANYADRLEVVTPNK